MTDLRTAAQQALEAYDAHEPLAVVMEELRAALAEEALQRLTDVQQEMERNFCPRCGKRTNDIHTCTPPDSKHATIKQHKPLTDEELSKIIDTQIGFNSCVGWEEDFARAIEKAHGIGV